jgi:hypothetical protein
MTRYLLEIFILVTLGLLRPALAQESTNFQAPGANNAPTPFAPQAQEAPFQNQVLEPVSNTMPLNPSFVPPNFPAEVENRMEAPEPPRRFEEPVVMNSPNTESVRSGSLFQSANYKPLKLMTRVPGPACTKEDWKAGKWFHGKHEKNFGWWWVVKDNYYNFAKRQMPFPDYEKRTIITYKESKPASQGPQPASIGQGVVFRTVPPHVTPQASHD